MTILEQFVRTVTDLVRGDSPTPTAAIAKELASLVAQAGWLGAEYLRPLAGRPYSQYPLHVAEDGSWSMVCFTWPAGATTPIHDHGVWAVVGQYQGCEEETSYRMRPQPTVMGSRVLNPGEVTLLEPPDDIHAVANRGDSPAVSIHIYGTDIGAHRRRTFDATTGAVSEFISGYDQPEKGT